MFTIDNESELGRKFFSSHDYFTYQGYLEATRTTMLRPRVGQTTIFGNSASGRFWVEYPSGLIDITSSRPSEVTSDGNAREPKISSHELEFDVQDDRKIRLNVHKSALVVIDMQK